MKNLSKVTTVHIHTLKSVLPEFVFNERKKSWGPLLSLNTLPLQLFIKDSNPFIH